MLVSCEGSVVVLKGEGGGGGGGGGDIKSSILLPHGSQPYLAVVVQDGADERESSPTGELCS